MPRKQPQKLKQKKPYVAPKCVELKGEDVSIWQRDQLRMAQALDRMEIDPPEMVRRIRALLEKRTKKYLGQNVTIFVKNVTQEELDIIARLRKAGILTEMPFDFKLKTPPAAELLKKAAGIQKGSGKPLTDKVGKITKAQIRAIAEKKMPDLNAVDIEGAMKIIEGTARQMGLIIE